MNRESHLSGIARIVTGALLLSIAISPALLGAESTIAGAWEGGIQFTTTKAPIELRLNEATGAIAGELILPGQDGKGVALLNVKRKSEKLNFDVKNGRAVARFEGKIAADGKAITGSFTQAGQTFPFELSKIPGELSQGK